MIYFELRNYFFVERNFITLKLFMFSSGIFDRSQFNKAAYPGESFFIKYDKYVIDDNSSNSGLDILDGVTTKGIFRLTRAQFIALEQFSSLKINNHCKKRGYFLYISYLVISSRNIKYKQTFVFLATHSN